MKNIQIDSIKQKANERVKKQKSRSVKMAVYDRKTKQMKTKEYSIKSGKEGNTLKRLLLIVILIAIEIITLIILYINLISSFVWIIFIPYGIGVILACRVAVGKKNYDSKIAWILFLLIFAPIAIIIYLLAGELTATPLKTYKFKKINKNSNYLKENIMPDNIPIEVKQDINYTQNSSDYVAYTNSSAKYFSSSEDYFEDLLNKLKEAKEFIFIEMFIFESGLLTDAILEILTTKVNDGVDVRIIIDGLGSHDTLSYFKVAKLRKQGIKIVAFEPVLPIINFFVNYRNHRKIIIIDGQIGYLGGANIADEYINAKVRFGIWKDAAICLCGPAIKSLIVMFLRMWQYAAKERLDYDKYLMFTQPNLNQDGIMIPYGSGPNEDNQLAKGIYSNMIANAKNYLYIMTPYFIVDSNMIELLKTKALSGVDVRIIIPGIPDKRLVYLLTKANCERLLPGGVKVYTYTPGFIHSKVVIADDICAVVGSINFDFRSFYQQYESACYLTNQNTLDEIKQDFNKTFSVCQKIEKDAIKKANIFMRSYLAIIRLFAPLM